MQKQYPFAKGRRSLISILYAALISTLVIGNSGPITSVQAAPAGSTDITFKLGVYPEKLPKVCPRGKLNLYVDLSKSVHKEIGDKVWDLPGKIPGPTQIDGSVISGRGELKKQLQDIDGPPGTSIPFIFTADKPGKVTLKFMAYIKNSWIGANEKVLGSNVQVQKEVTLTVIPCKIKVKTVLQFPVEIYDITVVSDNAVMTADEQGNFTGSVSMHWVYSNFNLDPCTISIGATDSQVDLTGQLDDDGGQFAATETFQPQTDAGVVTCPGGSGGGSSAFTVNPLTFSVASSGGVVTQTVTAEGVSGLATIVVVPVEDKAVSFNAESPAALSPSAGWVMPWDNFPWSSSALRALR